VCGAVGRFDTDLLMTSQGPKHDKCARERAPPIEPRKAVTTIDLDGNGKPSRVSDV